METACKEFVKVLKDAERMGSHLNVTQVSKKLSRLPPNSSPMDVFNECKLRGWVMGSAWGPWLTDEGKKQAN